MKTSFKIVFVRGAKRPEGVTLMDDANRISGAIGSAPVFFGRVGQDVLFHLMDKESLDQCFDSGTLSRLEKLGFTPQRVVPTPERVRATLRVGRMVLDSLGGGDRILSELRKGNEGIDFVDAYHFPGSELLKVTLGSDSDSRKILDVGVKVAFLYVPPSGVKILKTLRIKQCLTCYALGHNSRTCPTPKLTRCSKCGSEGHRYGACGADGNKCLLCGGRHSAISDSCPERQKAAENAGAAPYKPLPTESYPRLPPPQTQPLPPNPIPNPTPNASGILNPAPKPSVASIPTHSPPNAPNPNASGVLNPTPKPSAASNPPNAPNPTPNPPGTKRRARSPAEESHGDPHTSMGVRQSTKSKKSRQDDPTLIGDSDNAGLVASTIGAALERESVPVTDKLRCPSGGPECTGLQKSQVLALSIVYSALLMSKNKHQVQELLSSALKDLGLPTFKIPPHILDSIRVGPDHPSFPHPASVSSTSVKEVPSSGSQPQKGASQARESRPIFKVHSARATSQESARRPGGLMVRVPVPRASSTGRPKLNLTTLTKETLKTVSHYPKPSSAVQTHPAHQAN